MNEILVSVLIWLVSFPFGGPTTVEVAMYLENGQENIVVQSLYEHRQTIEITTVGGTTNYRVRFVLEPYQRIQYHFDGIFEGYLIEHNSAQTAWMPFRKLFLPKLE